MAIKSWRNEGRASRIPSSTTRFWRKWLDIAEVGTIKYIKDAKAKAKSAQPN
jgi:hypothetical protein